MDKAETIIFIHICMSTYIYTHTDTRTNIDRYIHKTFAHRVKQP